MNYLKKYLKYKAKYLKLKSHSGGVLEIFPRHAAKRYKLDDKNEYPIGSEIKVLKKHELLDHIDNGTKLCSLLHKADITEEILRKYRDKIIYLYQDHVSFDYINNDNLNHILIVTDIYSVDAIMKLLQNPELCYSLTELNTIFSGGYFAIKEEDYDKEINLFILCGFLFSYYIIDIYGFIYDYFNSRNLKDKFTCTYTEFIGKYFKPFLEKIKSHRPQKYLKKLMLEYFSWTTYSLEYVEIAKIQHLNVIQKYPLKLSYE